MSRHWHDDGDCRHSLDGHPPPSVTPGNHTVTSHRVHVLALCLSVAGANVLAAQSSADSAARAIVASERALGGRASARRTLAVLPFSVTSADTSLAPLGFGLAEFLSDDLAHSHRLTMVERVRLADVQREQSLNATDNIDRATGIRIGQLVAAQHLIFGAIDAPSPGAVTLDERLVNVETGAIEMHHTQSSPIDAIFRAERDLVMQTFSAFGITLTADEKRSMYERVAPEFRAFLVFSRGVRAESQGNDELALTSFQEAVALDRNFKLAATKLAAARMRTATVPSAASTSAAREAAEVKGPSKDGAREIGGSAPGGGLSSSGAAAPDARSSPTTKTNATPAVKGTRTKGSKRRVATPTHA